MTTEAKQLQHTGDSTVGLGCSRCGLRYSSKTAYVACFVAGDTYESWLARQNEAVKEIAARQRPVRP